MSRHRNKRFSNYIERAKESDLMSRTVLSADERFSVQVAGITTLALDPDVRDQEFAALLKAGCPAHMIEDIIIQMAAYIGYPKVDQALSSFARAQQGAALKTEPPLTFQDNQPTDENRYQTGIKDYAQLNPDALNTIQTAFGDMTGDFVHLTFRAFGDVFASSRQPLKLRQLATVSALAVLGCAAPQLRFHINAAFHVGLTQDQIVETIAWTQFFAGMPAAYNALVELKGALSEGAAPAYK